jgi:hypothetical protein
VLAIADDPTAVLRGPQLSGQVNSVQDHLDEVAWRVERCGVTGAGDRHQLGGRDDPDERTCNPNKWLAA